MGGMRDIAAFSVPAVARTTATAALLKRRRVGLIILLAAVVAAANASYVNLGHVEIELSVDVVNIRNKTHN